MLSARACDAQHVSDAARRAGMRERFERALTVFPDQSCICCSRAKREADDAQLMLSVAVEARRTLIGSTTTLAPTWTRLYRSITSSLTRRMHPDDTWPPMVDGSLVPWMR